MDKVTQSTAANAEESAAAAEELNAQAEQMKAYVDDLVTVVGGRSSSHQGDQRGSGREVRRDIWVLSKALLLSEKTPSRPSANRHKASKKVADPEEVIL